MGSRYFHSLLTFSRILGFAAAIVYIVLYVVFMFTVYGSSGVDWMTYAMGGYMILLGLLAAWSSLKSAVLLLTAAFIASFFLPPVGLYFLGVPSFMFWAGVCNLLYLAAAIIMLVGKLGVRYLERAA